MVAVSRKRVLRVIPERRLTRRRGPLARRRRPGFFPLERLRQLRQLDVTAIWAAENGWTIGAYAERHHDRPYVGLSYRTPDEMRPNWEDGQSGRLRVF